MKQKLWQVDPDLKYEHPWPQVQEVPEGNHDYLGESMEGSAMSLLGEEDTHKVLQRQQNELIELAVCLKQWRRD